MTFNHTKMISQKKNLPQRLLLKAMKDTMQKCKPNASMYSRLYHNLPAMLAAFVFLLYTPCEAAHREELPSLLVVHYNPPISAAVNENQQAQVEVHTQLNLTDILTPNGMIIKADDPHFIPMWIRCPGRLTAVPEPSHLLDILNGTIDVVPEDFLHNVSTVLTLRGKKLGHVKLTLYWELTNDSMCRELPEDLFSEKTVASLQTINQTEHQTIPVLEPRSMLGVESSPGPSATERTKITNTTKKQEVLKKKFVLVRQPSTKTKTKSSEENDNAPIVTSIFGRRKRSVDLSNDKPILNNVIVQHDSSTKIVIAEGYNIHVIREENIVDTVLLFAFSVFIINILVISFRIDIQVLKNIIRKPVGLLIVAVWQVLILPIVSYGFSYIYFNRDSTAQFGLFALSCSPVAILSIAWAFIKDGDVHLSIMITLTSIFCSLFTMPFWLHTLGTTLLGDNSITVPYLWLFGSLLMLLISLAISVAVEHFSSEIIKITTEKYYQTISWIAIIIISILGIVRCFYSLNAINWQLATAGLVIASFGYAFGFVASRLVSLEAKSAVSISIAAAFQNPEISFHVLQQTLPQPDSDLSSVPPLVQILLTSLPLILTQLYVIVMKAHHKENKADSSAFEEVIRPLNEPNIYTVRDSNDSNTYIATEPFTDELVNDEELITANTNDGRRNTFNTFGK